LEFATLMMLALAVSMDTFAVAVCKGISKGKFVLRYALTITAWFAAFNLVMPGIGYLLGTSASGFLAGIDHFILFAVLVILGVKSILEARRGEEDGTSSSTAFGPMFALSLALSLDALAVGISVALKSDIVSILLAIGSTTAVMTFLGVLIGCKFGDIIGKKGNYIGGAILIVIGTLALLEGVGMINLL